MSIFFPQNCKVTPQLFASAKAQANQIPLLNNSIRKGAGTLVGCIGEQGFLHLFPDSVSYNTYQHDIIWNDLKIEVKTKDRTVHPRLDYDVSVANYNISQDADLYAFMSVYRNKFTDRYIRVHFCGFFPKKEYFEVARFLNKGDYDPTNDYYVQADCWNLSMRELER